MPTLNDVLAGSQAQAVQVQQIIDALKGTPNKGVPVALVSLNDPNNYALTIQNDDPVNSRALSVLKADGTTLISADATGVTLGAPVNVPAGALNGTQLANASVSNAKLGSDTARLNLLTNGGFEIWQRGNGPFTANVAFSADRWTNNLIGTDTLSVSRDTANVDSPASAACAACTFVLGSGAGATALYQKMEDATQLRGRVVSFSVRVRTATASAARAAIYDGSAWQYGSFHPGGGAYATLTVTATIGASASLAYAGVAFAASCTAYVDNAMLVVGSQYADYAPLHPADDLARCLRYYEILSPEFGAYANAGSQGMGYGVPYKAHKPVTPTITKVGTWGATNCGQPQSVTRAGLSGTGLESAFIFATSTAAGYVQFYSLDATCGISVEANP